ncbi:hypothetical protein [Dermatobacter hominis]|uniref:hypothetical protein n=1 Tax=Dermatobacter hominis TaxID=2884263 RepID=UPI001D12CF9B|nr:hypothetical protein [Dermatobacter hominis]UDY34683.1 hypothetical protein LH044_15240 [Dermatobacter hominis]
MSSNRRMGVAAAALLGTGLVLMIVPPVLRDGICGLTSCADQVPVIAVSRVSASELAVVVPDEAAPKLRTVELLQGGGRGSGSRQWLIQRDAEGGEDPTTFLVGSEPEGFRTVVPLDGVPDSDVWTAQVGFRCTTASLPFDPEAIAVGEVRSWDGVMDGNEFASTANTAERCVAERSSTEVVLLLLGAAAAVAGAVLGIVVVLRRPARFPEDPGGDGSGDEDLEVSDPSTP